jgi:hypothetical protein
MLFFYEVYFLVGSELVGCKALIVYLESGREKQCFGLIEGCGSVFVSVQTEGNKLFIPVNSIQKIKLRSGRNGGGVE